MLLPCRCGDDLCRPNGNHGILAILNPANRSVNDIVAEKRYRRVCRKFDLDGQFPAAYRDARRLAFRQSVSRLQQASSAAVTTLLKIMVDPTAPHSTRVRAADSVLDHSAKAIEIEDVEARVAELERAAEAARNGK